MKIGFGLFSSESLWLSESKFHRADNIDKVWRYLTKTCSREKKEEVFYNQSQWALEHENAEFYVSLYI